jgi:hypothetical protein
VLAVEGAVQQTVGVVQVVDGAGVAVLFAAVEIVNLVEVGELAVAVVAGLAVAEASLQLVGLCQHHGSFYMAPLTIYPHNIQSLVSAVYSTGHSNCLFLFVFLSLHQKQLF